MKNVCVDCEKELVLKPVALIMGSGSGEGWVCPDYPKCRFTGLRVLYSVDEDV